MRGHARRSLLGEAEFHRSGGTLTVRQLSWARVMAAQVDVLLLLEGGDGVDVMLQAGLGWFRTMGGHKSRWVRAARVWAKKQMGGKGTGRLGHQWSVRHYIRCVGAYNIFFSDMILPVHVFVRIP